MSEGIIQRSESFVQELLGRELQAAHHFHNWIHTNEVRQQALTIGRRVGLSAADLEVLELAALFHDVGYIEAYDGHEAVSQGIAERFLIEQGYPEARCQRITAAIAATRYDCEPRNPLEAILRDADLSNLASEQYLDKLALLRAEWEHFRGEVYDAEEWRKLNRRFFKNHQYHTSVARDLFGPGKRANFDRMKSPDKKTKKNKKKKTPDRDLIPLADSKSVQVMFKTASRNHIDLTNLADNKANIMLSINAIIITITIPLMPTYLEQDMTLLIPATTLLLTCVVSVIFATLATRPISMKGVTSAEQIRSGKSNLFFFGNFYRMNIQEYTTGMKEVINNEEVLEDSAIRDLYFLGAALGNKYKLLRNCYTIFMVGITSTVLIFALIKMLNGV
ncbi:MAG: Pycsar system effector family protein [Bacteroidota bacterium]